jgi:hypothetical protein
MDNWPNEIRACPIQDIVFGGYKAIESSLDKGITGHRKLHESGFVGYAIRDASLHASLSPDDEYNRKHWSESATISV